MQHNFTIVGRICIPDIATEKRIGFNALANNPPEPKHRVTVWKETTAASCRANS